MKKIITLSCLLFLFGIGAKAQDAADNATKLTEYMKTDLDLSAEQCEEVYAANLAFTQGMSAAKKSGESKMGLLKKVKALDKDRTRSLKKILTEEQFRKYESTKKKNRKKMKEMYKSKQ